MVTRRVVGTWRALRPDGTRVPGQGTITFEPSVLIRDSNTNQIVVQDAIVVTLNGQGQIDIHLQTTDQEGLNPTGWFWQVTEEITGQTVRRYQLELPAGANFDLSTVAVPPTAVPLRPQDQYLKRLEIGDTTVLNPNETPTVDQTSVNSVATLDFGLPRAPDAEVGNVTVGTPAQGPAVSSTATAEGDARFNFRLPRSRNVQAGTTSMVNSDQPAVLSTTEDGNGDLTLDLSVPRAALVTVGTVTESNPDVTPTVSSIVTDGDVALNFGLPRAADITLGTVTPVNPDVAPDVSFTTTDGDVEVGFELPRAAEVTVDEPATVLNPDQQPAVTSTVTDGDVEIAFSLPRAPAVTVDTPATVLNPDQQPAVSSTTTDGDVEIQFSLPAAPTFAVGTVTTVGPSDPADATDVGTNGNIVIDFDLPRGEKGWSPVLNLVADGARRVLQVDDWVGGEGTKPATGDYVGTSGLVSDISLAVNIRGEQGPSGTGALNDLSDVIITTVSGGQILVYDAAIGNWVNKTPDTDDVAEGGTNLYYTDQRVEDVIDASTTDDLSEGTTNLYYTDQRADDRADGRIAASTTDDITEGATNLYYTDGRASDAAPVQDVNSYTGSVVLDASDVGAVDLSGDTMTGILTAPNFYVQTSTAASNTIDINFDDIFAYVSRGVTGDLVFTGSNYLAGGIKSARLVNGGTQRNVSFPAGWVFVGVKPTTLAANKTAIFTVTSFATTEGECVASWAVEF